MSATSCESHVEIKNLHQHRQPVRQSTSSLSAHMLPMRSRSSASFSPWPVSQAHVDSSKRT